MLDALIEPNNITGEPSAMSTPGYYLMWKPHVPFPGYIQVIVELEVSDGDLTKLPVASNRPNTYHIRSKWWGKVVLMFWGTCGKLESLDNLHTEPLLSSHLTPPYLHSHIRDFSGFFSV